MFSLDNLGGSDLNGFFGRGFDSELSDSIGGGEFRVILLEESSKLDRNLLRCDVSEFLRGKMTNTLGT